ncbi:helix-turn-helix domain-containing protein [Streptomyces sp. NPDC057307]|uniref:helix-turn-helix domain-containing protein n=1 Tax=Streptomyces sp. NPDC057307 TaxID=3346096 RepID=UPI003637F7A3
MSEPTPPFRPVPTELAALAAGVTPATIRKWASRGKITRYGEPRRALYDLTELLELAADRRDGPDSGDTDAS